MQNWDSPTERGLDIIRDELSPLVEAALLRIHGENWLEIINSRRRADKDFLIRPSGKSADWTPDEAMEEIAVHMEAVRHTEMTRIFTCNIDHEPLQEKQIQSVLQLIRRIVSYRNNWAHRRRSLTRLQVTRFLKNASDLLNAAGQSSPAANCLLLIPPAREFNDAIRYPLTSDELRTFSIAQHLDRLKVGHSHVFSDAGITPTSVAIGDIFELITLLGPDGKGMTADNIVVDLDPSAKPHLPPYVQPFIDNTPVPEDNSPLGYVNSWELMDGGPSNKLSLSVAPGDWRTKSATQSENCATLIHQDIVRRAIDPFTFSGFLSVAITFETSDNKIAMCFRPHWMSDESRQWAIGIGRNMYLDTDQGDGFALHPIRTVHNGLRRKLGIPDETLEASEIRFHALGLSMNNFSLALFGHAKIPATMQQILDWWKVAPDGLKDSRWPPTPIDYELSECLHLIIYGKQLERLSISHQAAVTSWSRLALLYAVQQRWGSKLVCTELAKH